MRRFHHKVAFITGAAHGIGKACAHRLASEGARIAVVDIDDTAAEQTVTELTATGAEAIALHCDVTDRNSIQAAVSATTQQFGELNVLINNVGIAGPISFPDLDETEWHRQRAPTLDGAIWCIQACLPYLLDTTGGGSVVSISSVNGMAAVGAVAYSAAKAGLINVTANLALQYGRNRQDAINAESGWIRFNSVAPGTVHTRVWDSTSQAQNRLTQLRDLYPAGRVGQPDDIAAATAFLASHDADWITGVTLPVDGGLLAGPQWPSQY